MQTKKSGLKNLLRWLPGVLISAIAIYAVLKFINFDDLKNAFQTVKPGFILMVCGISLIGYFLRGKAWQVILGKGVTFKQSFFGVSEGYFLNNVLPFRAGEIARSFFVGRSTGKGTFYVLSTIIIERAFDIAFAASYVIITLPFLLGMDWIKPVATIALILVFAALFILFLVARNKDKVLGWANKITKPNKIVKFILPRVESIIEGFSLLAKPSQFLLSLLWIGINWVVWTSSYCLVVRAVIPGAPIWWGVFLTGVMALGVAIPSAPSALGVYEASFVGAIAILGGQTGKALAYAIIMHLIAFVMAAIFGVWGLFREGLGFSKIFSTFGSSEVKTDSIENKNEGV
jgi:glycosyltransferase 2 family protein